MFDDRIKRHTHRQPFKQHSDKKRKMIWFRAGGGSGACAVIRLKPKLAMTKLYLVAGGAGTARIDNTTGDYVLPQTAGYASGIGTLPDYSSNILIAAGASASWVKTCTDGGVAPVLNTGGFADTFDILRAVSLTAGNKGTPNALYNSYVAPSTTGGVSAYDGTATGYGAGGYNSGNTNIAAVGGYVKVTIV